MSQSVKEYYDSIATEYDSSRFENSYGEFIDKQERKFIEKFLQPKTDVLSLGCGTGRFMEYSSVGLDFSPQMLEIAKKKHPQKLYFTAPAENTGLEANTFDTILCFHVIMHLNPLLTSEILTEALRILKPGGRLIIDFPSKGRRKLTRFKAQNWHGANSFSKSEFKNLLSSNWKIEKKRGVLFFPIHLFPKKMRKFVFGCDQVMAKSCAKHYSSYLMYSILKK
jgi:ubiquinone/menaquinone biosynthesis C-methylase UbiE